MTLPTYLQNQGDVAFRPGVRSVI